MAAEEPEDMPEGAEPPPRGVRVMALVRWLLVVAAAVLAAFVWLSYARAHLSTAKPAEGLVTTKYHCPMHPQIVTDGPGECPICHMTLEPFTSARSSVPADAGNATRHDAASDAAPEPGSVPPGTIPVQLTLDRIQSIGVRTAVAEERTLAAKLRVTAVVTPTERGVSEVHVRVPGFVEAMHVDETGVSVRAGQAMISVYSPEILQAENELLATAQWAGDAGASTSASGRRKLELLGMAPSEIERVLLKREALRAITITAPRAGSVTKKNVVLGSYVTPEIVLYEVQDLSKVYVVADVFLSDAASVVVGAEGRFEPTGHPERASVAKVDLVYPLVNTESRTRRVRMQVRNDASLRYAPGDYGTVELAVGARHGVAIPRDALVETGSASYVFLAEEGGRFSPRIVVTGASELAQVIVVSGLAAGERVVSGATFLIDSESRLQASMSQAAPP